MRNNSPLINVYEKKSFNSKLITQLLYGDTFKKIGKIKKWIKIKTSSDKYSGYIRNKNFLKNEKSTHKISDSFANLYSKPSKKNKIKMKLYFGSKIKIIKRKGSFLKFDNLWINSKNIKKISYVEKNYFNKIKFFLKTKYKWGGKSIEGIDCSALVQLFLNFNNRYCPRDTKDQIKYFKKNIKLTKINKNDLIFWKGHVAVAISDSMLIHAYGPMKKVVCMPIKIAIKRIYKTANLKVLAIKRI